MMKRATVLSLGITLLLSMAATADELKEMQKEEQALELREQQLHKELQEISKKKQKLMQRKAASSSPADTAGVPEPMPKSKKGTSIPKWKSDLPEGWESDPAIPQGYIPLEKVDSSPNAVAPDATREDDIGSPSLPSPEVSASEETTPTSSKEQKNQKKKQRRQPKRWDQ